MKAREANANRVLRVHLRLFARGRKQKAVRNPQEVNWGDALTGRAGLTVLNRLFITP